MKDEEKLTLVAIAKKKYKFEAKSISTKPYGWFVSREKEDLRWKMWLLEFCQHVDLNPTIGEMEIRVKSFLT